MDYRTHEAIAALITGDATPDQQSLVYKELVSVKTKLAALRTENEQLRTLVSAAETALDAYRGLIEMQNALEEALKP